MANVVYKIMTAAEWRSAQEGAVYHGSADDVRDGFIHFSTWEQAPATLAKHFAKVADDLVLLRINVSDLESNLRWEESRGGSLFPHLYAPLPASAVSAVFPIGRDKTGALILPMSCA